MSEQIRPWQIDDALQQIPRLTNLLQENAQEFPTERAAQAKSEATKVAELGLTEAKLRDWDLTVVDQFVSSLSVLGGLFTNKGRLSDALECLIGAHEILRLRYRGRNPSEARRRCFDNIVRCLIRLNLKPVAGRDVHGGDAQHLITQLLSDFPEYHSNASALAMNGYLVEELETLRQHGADDEDFHSNIIKQNLKLVLTLPVPKRCSGIKRTWRQLGEQVAPYVLMEVAEVSPQPEDSLSDLIPSNVRDDLQRSIETADVSGLRRALEDVESALTRNLELRLDVEPSYREPVSVMFDRSRKIDPYFDQAQKLLANNDSGAIRKFEEVQRRSKSSIATEWLAWAYIKFEPRRVHNIISVLEDCLRHQRFSEGHQWAARWNLGCALRSQKIRKDEALTILLPVLTKTLYRPSEILDTCLLWAIEDGNATLLDRLLVLSRYAEAHLLAALNASRGSESANPLVMKDHFVRVETILHDPNVFPSPEEELSVTDLEAVADRFRKLRLPGAGIEWFQERLAVDERQRKSFKNYNCLGLLQEDAGDLSGAWRSYVRELEISMGNRRLHAGVKARNLTRVLQFANTLPEVKSDAIGVLNQHWEEAGFTRTEFDRWTKNLSDRPATFSNPPTDRSTNGSPRQREQEPSPPRQAVANDQSAGQGASVKYDADTAQRIIDEKAHLFKSIRKPHELLGRIPDARELCRANATKYKTIPEPVLTSYERFFQSIDLWGGGVSEDKGNEVIEELRTCLVAINSAGSVYRDLQELSAACGRVVQDMEVQLRQQISISLKLPSALGTEIERAAEGEEYSTRVFTEVRNPYEFEIPLKWLHVATTSQALRFPAEGIQLERTVPALMSDVVECPVTVQSSKEEEAPITCHVQFDVGGITRSKRDSDRLRIRKTALRIPVEERYTTGPIPPGRDDLFHGREQAMSDLMLGMSGGQLKTLYFINGIRRVGKTTLLRQIGHRMGGKVLPLILDLQVIVDLFGSVGSIPTSQFVRQLTISILGWIKKSVPSVAVSLQPLTESDFASDPIWSRFDGWLGELLSQSSRSNVLLCVDEMQSVVRLMAEKIMDNSFLTWLRSKVESHSDTLIICTASEPYGKMRMRHEHNLWGSIKTYRISFLQKSDMAKVAQEPVQGDGVRWLGEAIDALWDMTEGHPWITQGICDRVMRDLNVERRRIIGPADIQRATENLILDDPTAVRLWWNESQELVSADMLKLAHMVLELQQALRGGVSEAELIRECVRRGVKSPGTTIPEMIELELLTKRSRDNRLTIRSRFLENFLADMKSRMELQERTAREISEKSLVALAIDWENAKTRLVEYVERLEPARANRLRPMCSGEHLGRKLIERAEQLGYSTRDTRIAVAGFEGNSFFKGDRAALDNLNINTQNSNVSGNVKADRSDHRLIQRIRDLLELHSGIETYVIAAGDADFSETVSTLLDRGKTVHMMCTRDGMAHYYESQQKGSKKLTIDFIEDFAFAQ